MNYFEQELRRLFGNDTAIADKWFVGRAFFGKLTDGLRVSPAEYRSVQWKVQIIMVMMQSHDIIKNIFILSKDFRDERDYPFEG